MKLRAIDVFVDRGGTFTDMVAVVGDERLIIKKVLSQKTAAEAKSIPCSEHALDPLTVGLLELLAECRSIYPNDTVCFRQIRIGTTVATNALLERKGEAVVLITNKGFGDALKIGYQNRPDIFALEIIKSKPLFSEVIELDCRYGADGEEVAPLDENQARAAILEAHAKGINSAAIVFMHGYKYEKHELACAEISTDIGLNNVSASCRVNPLIKFVGRGDTTLVDAYLTPALNRYTTTIVNELTANLPFISESKSLLFMKSDGGLASLQDFRGRDALLSGPAGGVVGAVRAAGIAGFENVVALDMGGTSTDVSYFEGEYERLYETTLAGVRIRAPMLAVHTVAAGGGSILEFDGARFLVGPHSAGAVPGPACYGHEGPATVTDANLLLGRISARHFPHSFGPDFAAALSLEASEKAFKNLQKKIIASTGTNLGSEPNPYEKIEHIAWGYLTIAVEKMAQAIAHVSTQKGHDVTEAVLVAFGGAGGQHACLIAERLGIKKILLHPLAGVLSAWGIGATERTTVKERAIGEKLDEQLLATLPCFFSELSGVDEADNTMVENKLFLHYSGSDTKLTVVFREQSLSEIYAEFSLRHKKLFGFAEENGILIAEAAMTTITTCGSIPEIWQAREQEAQSTEEERHRMFAAGNWHDVAIRRRSELKPGTILQGPLLIAEETSTTVLEPGWEARVANNGSLIITKENSDIGSQSLSPALSSEAPDPVRLELFSNIFMSIAEEMGLTLQQVSHSVNIKERLDFSCAIFDSQGRLIANAPHIPVHLGSMGDSVRSLIQSRSSEINLTGSASSHLTMNEGDVYVLNNPYNGGTHLPDITVVSPVFIDGALSFFTASRGHHADIGGISPGSMPADSKNIEEEGVLIDNFQVVDRGRFLESQLISLLESAKYPPRNIKQNIADLKAQIAANNKGILGLRKAVAKYGLSTVNDYMNHVRTNAAQAIRKILPDLKDGEATCTMDNGSVIKVKVTLDSRNEKITVDFNGTSPQATGNLNSPIAVCRAAVLYVFRTLTKAAIPLNDGCLEPVELIIPPGLLNPKPPAAVVAGNVETSQIIVDVLYRALGIMAASQGTMNNLTFGDGTHQYYETICGGSGAGADFEGADAVQTHMTNSRLTDPEILETRFPVRLEEFSIRAGSGGVGRRSGGCGAIRRIRFLKPMAVSILSNRRLIAPPGLNGGADGSCGHNILIAAQGTIQELGPTAAIAVAAGDAVQIETPGGGGFN